MCCKYPTDENQFLNITGVGQNKFEKYGMDFINVIKSYLNKNNIDITKYIPKSSKPEKIDTKIISYNLYKEGKSINKIAEERNLTRSTIEGHLVKCFELGMEIDLEKEINTNYEKLICDTIKKVGTEKLRNIKDSLPYDVTYLDIKYYIAKLGL